MTIKYFQVLNTNLHYIISMYMVEEKYKIVLFKDP